MKAKEKLDWIVNGKELQFTNKEQMVREIVLDSTLLKGGKFSDIFIANHFDQLMRLNMPSVQILHRNIKTKMEGNNVKT